MARSNESEPEVRHVIVSGVSRGLGAAIAQRLLREGYVVSGCARGAADAALLRHEQGFWFAQVDLADPEAVRAFVDAARQRFGPIYGLINNAAVVQEGILATLPEIEIERMLTVNLSGAIRLARLAVRDMIERSRGRVINVSSIVGSRGYNGLSVYSATKAGLDGLTRSLAREVGKRNVTVNSVAPGYMRTAMSAALEPAALERIVRRTPLRRLVEIEDVVPLVNFLMSPQAGGITGQTILVDGGISY